MASLFLSGPCIARLCGVSRIAVFQQMRAGAFGELLRHGRSPYAALPAVEQYLGRSIAPEQLEAAAAGFPDRIITIAQDHNGTV